MPVKRECLIGIDCGTTRLRCGVFDLKGSLVAQADYRFKLKIPRVGWAEQDANEWVKGLTIAARNCVEQLAGSGCKVIGIGLAATSASVVTIGEDRTPLCDAIMWMDVRSQPQTEKIKKQASASFLDNFGGQINAEWFIPKALWLKENRPKLFQRAYRIVDAVDWLTFFLTGAWVGSVSNATNSGAFFPSAGGWAEDTLNAIGLKNLPDKLVDRVANVGALAGQLTDEAARAMGLPSGLPVGVGGIDCHIGMIGLNSLKEGKLALIIGSSSCHLALTRKAHYFPGIWGPYESAVLPDMWLIETGQTTTGSILRWFQSQFAAGGEPIELLSKEAEKIKPGAEDLILLDTWQGNRSPHNESFTRGGLIGLSLRHTRAHILRAIFEGICFGASASIDHTERHSRVTITQIDIGGGGTANRFWMQMHADIIGRRVCLTAEPEATLLGAAICGGTACAIFRDLKAGAKQMVRQKAMLVPDMKNHHLYRRLFDRYRDAYAALRPLFHKMTH
jgi:FGGY-family pentulose kinase